MKEIEALPVDWHRRGCYCFLWHEGRELLEKMELPYGFCGICGLCGTPGHTRHAPTGPSTASWCDECWTKLVTK